MRRVWVIAMLAGTLAGPVASTAGCAGNPPAAPEPAREEPAADWPAGLREAEIYGQVLSRFLTTPADNSFPERAFTTVYVLDQAHPGAGDPVGEHERGTPLAPNTQHRIVTALADVAPVAFITDPEAVIERRDGCPQVRDGGILITLGTVDGDDNQARVPINGFVACLGATWLTYVVRNEAGFGWRVTGTTGTRAIA
ncbi:hypothetical protein ACFFMM_24000 [Micromonospora chaiyaphumensis]|uniref:Sporulation and spore germination n=1 Tax=Micromonospora chaiyaphumensis TaxID=307119 RepID=A0A1C4UTY3_9ACTN|nr:hypothetical protein [Micromonospora chaiyaphumensis]SCE75055.1 hypothetical protein GA0070214_1011003 [Micromonospora chaiyaphumensis]